MKERPVVPQEEMLRQQEFMKLVCSLDQRPRSYHIVSMGCQMNERDSESIAGMLEQMGFWASILICKIRILLFRIVGMFEIVRTVLLACVC